MSYHYVNTCAYIGVRKDEHPEMLPAAAADDGPGISIAAADQLLARAMIMSIYVHRWV
jgi:hypothetical protein